MTKASEPDSSTKQTTRSGPHPRLISRTANHSAQVHTQLYNIIQGDRNDGNSNSNDTTRKERHDTQRRNLWGSGRRSSHRDQTGLVEERPPQAKHEGRTASARKTGSPTGRLQPQRGGPTDGQASRGDKRNHIRSEKTHSLYAHWPFRASGGEPPFCGRSAGTPPSSSRQWSQCGPRIALHR